MEDAGAEGGGEGGGSIGVASPPVATSVRSVAAVVVVVAEARFGCIGTTVGERSVGVGDWRAWSHRLACSASTHDVSECLKLTDKGGMLGHESQ